jgi:hypothetical protein
VNGKLNLVGIGLGEVGRLRDDVHRLERAPALSDPFGERSDFPGIHGNSS